VSEIAFERTLDALTKATGTSPRGRGDQRMSICPAHDDRNPSLSLTRGHDRVLMYCQAGCDTDEVLSALDMSAADLFDTPVNREPYTPRSSSRLVATYDYTDEQGQLLFQVCRWEPKTFRQRRSDGNGGWLWKLGDTRRVLYRLPNVLAAVVAGQTVYVVEGEKDVLALESVGAVATCSPMGAGKWQKVDPAPLAGAHVVVVSDRDEPGEKHARAVVESLDGAAASVRLALPRVGKDAADHIAAGHSLDDLVPAELPTVDEASELGQPRLRLKHAHQAVVRRVHYLWAGRIPLGAATVMPGEEGIGKSTVLTRLAADVTRGTLAGDLEGQPRHVLIIAPEDHFEAVAVPRLEQAGADLTKVTCVEAAVALGEIDRDVVIPRDLALIEATVREFGTALVWVDSLVTTLPDDTKSTAYKDIAKILKALGAAAERVDVAVVAPWHLNKTSGSDTALRMMDSRAFRTATRSVLLMVADPEKPGEGVVALDKANAGTLAVPAIRYRLVSATYTVTETDEQTGEIRQLPASCGVAHWVGVEVGDGRQLARDLLTPGMVRDDDPKAWLRGYLRDGGETLRKTVIAAGTEAGFGAKQLQRAAQTLRVVYRDQVNERPGSTQLKQSTWRLPDLGQDSRSPYAPPTVPTVLTEPLKSDGVSSSSLIKGGEDGRDGQVDVAEVSSPLSSPCPDRLDEAPRCPSRDARRDQPDPGNKGRIRCPQCRLEAAS